MYSLTLSIQGHVQQHNELWILGVLPGFAHFSFDRKVLADKEDTMNKQVSG